MKYLFLFYLLFSFSLFGQTNNIIISNSSNVVINITINNFNSNTNPLVQNNTNKLSKFVISPGQFERMQWENMLDRRREAAFNDFLRRQYGGR